VAEEAVKLNYINNVFESLQRTGQTINSLIAIQTIICLVIIALCLNPFLIDTECSFGGLTFYLTTSFIIAGGAWIAGMTIVISIALIRHENELLENITRLYKSLSYSDATMENKICNVLEHPNFMTVVLEHTESNITRKIIYYIMIIIIFVLPLITQLSAAYRVTAMFNFNLLLIAIFLILIIFTGYYIFNYLYILFYK
jgi:hypothetical protein